VGRRESALPILLSLTGSLLVALVDRSPLAGARDVHSLFDTEVVAATGTHAALSRRLIAVPLVPNSDTRTRGFAGVDVVASVTPTDWLEDAGTIATCRTWNTPIHVRVRRHALVADEAIVGRTAMHRRIAAAAVLHMMLAAHRILHGIGTTILAADEALERADLATALLSAARDRQNDGAQRYKSQPISFHRISPRTGGCPLYRQL
jgi:hypothetical protein